MGAVIVLVVKFEVRCYLPSWPQSLANRPGSTEPTVGEQLVYLWLKLSTCFATPLIAIPWFSSSNYKKRELTHSVNYQPQRSIYLYNESIELNDWRFSALTSDICVSDKEYKFIIPSSRLHAPNSEAMVTSRYVSREVSVNFLPLNWKDSLSK